MLKKWFPLLALVVLFLVGCSKYQRILKGKDFDLKYETAVQLFEKEKYERALPLFEELVPLFRGTARAEKVYYYYCYCNYYMDFLYESAYHFKKFSQTFPASKHAEEALFMNAYCHYILSPIPSLDPTDTYKAINELQLFANTYPQHELIDSTNVLMDKLRSKLEEKSYQNSKQYYQIYDYKAAIVALNNTLIDFPDTKHKEEIMLLIVKSSYYLAINSIKEKKLERFNNTIEAYYNFVDSFKESKFLKEAENYYNRTVTELDKFKLENL
ncbi:MAG: outer membrane protein assembly factor BamD [Flavobacteriales bacterium]|nr:outer membrane protein assembly factor BamD [Flavobacteriales bacterium]